MSDQATRLRCQTSASETSDSRSHPLHAAEQGLNTPAVDPLCLKPSVVLDRVLDRCRGTRRALPAACATARAPRFPKQPLRLNAPEASRSPEPIVGVAWGARDEVFGLLHQGGAGVIDRTRNR